MKWLIRLGTHLAAGAIGFALGIYLLPILIAPDGPTESEVRAVAGGSRFTAAIRRDLEDSDALHWGEGTMYVGPETIAFEGRLAPGPDYRLYLSPRFVETESAFLALKADMVEVGQIRTFENFTLPIPASIDPANFNSVIVWCESFNQFITAGEYQ